MKCKLCALAAVAAIGLTSLVNADVVVYDSTHGGTQAIDQQTGNNFYYIGDTATIAPTTKTLTTVAIPFSTTALAGQGPFNYTPNLTLDLYATAADANSQTGLIGSANVNNAIFHNDGVVDPAYGYNFEDEKFLTFNFASQNIVLPTTFVFAYHDTASLDSNGNVYGANGFSVGLTAQPASPGTSIQNAFATYPNSTSGTVINTAWDAGYNIEAKVSLVPLPSPAWGGLALIGCLGLVTSAKRMRRQAV